MDHLYLIFTVSFFIADLAIRIGLSGRIIMRQRAASVTLGWLVIILLLPLAGAVIYLLLGENRLGENRAKRAAANIDFFSRWAANLKKNNQVNWTDINPECLPINRQINTLFSIPAMPGNDLELLDNSDDFFDALLKDIHTAQSFCYLQFYIMQQGGNVDKVVQELISAADRGVTCKLLLDSIGSNDFLAGSAVEKMRAAGIKVVEALPAGIFRSIFVRIDLRNHRKMVIIDSAVAYTGSQNLVDPDFFKQDSGIGQWQDCMSRIRGPLIEVMTAAFLYDWTLETGVTIDSLVEKTSVCLPGTIGDAVVQMVPSGPGFRESAIHDLLLTTIYAARKELILTTPYFVPDNAILTALKSAAGRGVEVTVIVPEKNDSRLVHYASHAMFEDLMRTGVRIMLFSEGLLHSKTITIDNDFCLFGSVNLDMRSFWLNFEMTLLACKK